MPEGSTIAWLHCFSGVTPEMIIGAFVDAGVDLDEVRALCDRLPLDGWELEAQAVRRSGLPATRVALSAQPSTVVRTGAHIAAMVDEARLPERVRDRAQAAFERLVEADGRVHRRPPDQIQFHDLGDIATIVEVVGVCAALEIAGIDELHCSAVALGQGMVRGGLGMMPIPRPLTVELLRDAPTYGLEVPMELTTPTGAALVSALSDGFGTMPPMHVRSSGYGAGPADIDGRPRVTQTVIGLASGQLAPGRPMTVLHANLSDATGEAIAHAMGAIRSAGADEVWVSPVLLDRGRPGHIVSALVDSALSAVVADAMANETGAMSIRGTPYDQWSSSRHDDEVDVEGRRVRVEVSTGRVKVGHDDAARAARHIGIPVREVVSLAEEAWRRRTRGELTEVVPLQTGSDDDPDPHDDEPTSIA